MRDENKFWSFVTGHCPPMSPSLAIHIYSCCFFFSLSRVQFFRKVGSECEERNTTYNKQLCETFSLKGREKDWPFGLRPVTVTLEADWRMAFCIDVLHCTIAVHIFFFLCESLM